MTVNATSNYAPRKSAHEGANGLEQSRPSEAQVPSGAASGMGESVQILDRWYEQGYSAGSGEVARDAGRPALEPYDPLLAGENSTFSLLMRVEQLNSETQNAQLVSQQLGINVTDIKRNQLHEDNLKKFDEAIAKIRAAKRAAGIAGNFSHGVLQRTKTRNGRFDIFWLPCCGIRFGDTFVLESGPSLVHRKRSDQLVIGNYSDPLTRYVCCGVDRAICTTRCGCNRPLRC